MSYFFFSALIMFPAFFTKVIQKVTDYYNKNLFYFVETIKFYQVKFALVMGANVNSRDIDDNTPLILAAKNGDKKTVALLLRYGADIIHQNSYGWTALISATIYGHKEIVALLLSSRTYINQQRNYVDIALMWAAQLGHKDIAALLLNSGADVNHQNNNGDTALMLAAERGHKETVEVILTYLPNKIDVLSPDEDTQNLISTAQLVWEQLFGRAPEQIAIEFKGSSKDTSGICEGFKKKNNSPRFQTYQLEKILWS